MGTKGTYANPDALVESDWLEAHWLVEPPVGVPATGMAAPCAVVAPPS